MQAVTKAVDEELKSCGEDLLEKAKELAPESSGRLKRAGYTKNPTDEFRPKTYFRAREIGFDTRKHVGGAKAGFNYALMRHEVPVKAKYQKNKETGEMEEISPADASHTKFLETPYKANVDEYAKRILEAGAKAGMDGVIFRSTIVKGEK